MGRWAPGWQVGTQGEQENRLPGSLGVHRRKACRGYRRQQVGGKPAGRRAAGALRGEGWGSRSGRSIRKGTSGQGLRGGAGAGAEEAGGAPELRTPGKEAVAPRERHGLRGYPPCQTG